MKPFLLSGGNLLMRINPLPLFLALLFFAHALGDEPSLRFEAPISVALDDVWGHPQVGDFNRDGIDDVVVVRSYLSGMRLTTMIGSGAGWCQRSRDITIWDSVYDVETGDFDEDGLHDLAVVRGDKVEIFLGTGSVSSDYFQSSGLISLPTEMRVVRVADFDEDGHLDLALYDVHGGVRVGFGDGAGEFPTILPVGGSFSAPAVHDFNGDGHLDMAVGDYLHSRIVLFIGNGDGTFVQGDPILELPAVAWLQAGDFDEDGRGDLLARVDGEVYLVSWDSAGGFWERTPLGYCGRPHRVFDINRDGHEDFLLRDSTREGRLSIHLGDGEGCFQLVEIADVGEYASVAFLHLEEDEHSDMVVVRPIGETVLFMRGRGNGRFVLPSRHTVGENPSRATADDFNLDGYLDLAVPNQDSDDLSILLNDGLGGFGPALNIPVGDRPTQARSADLNDDGFIDLVVSNRLDYTVSVFRGDGSGAFVECDVIPVAGAHRVLVEDMNADGHLDLIAAAHQIQILLGDGSMGFAVGEPFTLGTGFSYGTSDFNEDGNLDVMSVAGSGIAIAFGDGQGGFGWANHTGVNQAMSFRLADLNGDGFQDRLIGKGGSYLSDIVQIQYGSSSGFGSSVIREPGCAPYAIGVEDLDRNGELDVVAINNESVDFSFFLAKSEEFTPDPPTFWPRRLRFGLDSDPTSMVVGDFDGDGSPDVAITHSDLDMISVVFNRTLDPIACRAGNVNANGGGGIANVLFVNGEPGYGEERILEVGPLAPFEIRMDLPPSKKVSRFTLDGVQAHFAVYAWLQEPTTYDVWTLPYDLGLSCMPIPIIQGTPGMPRVIWNNMMDLENLGEPTRPSDPAPTVFFSRPDGLGVSATVFLQGVIKDTSSPSGLVALTNGVLVIVE